ncbi:MAG TPA: sensor histidine kinase [Solirubrobacteraceae bacterium]|jgi:anti-sigma regulatory factor (Ser/Thr protein kinase)|nr:sensor histidine kinase [Solirubrobacteraceae bacterium]
MREPNPTRFGPDGAAVAAHGHSGYRHEAFFYAGIDGFMAGTVPLIRAATEAGEPILVVVGKAKLAALRDELGSDCDEYLQLADMAEVGANPARIIPVWQEFVDRNADADRRIWGIGEPVWAGRTGAELAECRRHEQLLNLVFPDPQFSLLCPYDTDTLADEVIEDAHRTHPFVREGARIGQSAAYAGAEALDSPFDAPLSDPPLGIAELAFNAREQLRQVRAFIAGYAREAGLAQQRISDLLLAANEVATNSLVHGAGEGVVAIWESDGTIICEVRDGGRIDDPLAGRRRPAATARGGRGLWLVNQVCDLVQMRSTPQGSTVRLHMRSA